MWMCFTLGYVRRVLGPWTMQFSQDPLTLRAPTLLLGCAEHFGAGSGREAGFRGHSPLLFRTALLPLVFEDPSPLPTAAPRVGCCLRTRIPTFIFFR